VSRARSLALLACVAPFALGSCGALGLGPRKVNLKHEDSVLASGVRYKELFLGRGPRAQMGDTVTLDYTLWLADGARVDSTLDRGVPMPVKVGEAPVRGLDDALVGMQADGRRRVTVPPELGYGADGVPDMIPPYSTLIFEVHVIEVTPQ
jgi:FKBP-type peptidyl-prolyl cis-trans isomerase